jgi:predicted GNAT superfamily acetyltransferase
VVVRDATPADHEVVRALNNGAVPHVNALTAEQFAQVVGYAAYFRVAEDDAGIAGFVLCVPRGTTYWSGNYAWFTARYADFLYLDRVVVAERARGGGVGRALYDDLVMFARGRWPRITLEVNLRPPNPGSVAFHCRVGFVEVGVREYDDGASAVVMMERVL